MQGYSPKLPLSKDPVDGLYAMNKTALETIKQDLRMLLLTNPGERMMIPDYGVGLRSLLFSQNTADLNSAISNNIYSQVAKYMPFVRVEDVSISTVENNENALYVAVTFFVPSLNVRTELNLALEAN